MQLGVKNRREQRKQTMSQRTDASREIQPVLTGDRHTDWALWRLSLVLAEIARNISGDDDYGAGNLPALDGEYQDDEKRKEVVLHGKKDAHG